MLRTGPQAYKSCGVTHPCHVAALIPTMPTHSINWQEVNLWFDTPCTHASTKLRLVIQGRCQRAPALPQDYPFLHLQETTPVGTDARFYFQAIAPVHTGLHYCWLLCTALGLGQFRQKFIQMKLPTRWVRSVHCILHRIQTTAIHTACTNAASYMQPVLHAIIAKSVHCHKSPGREKVCNCSSRIWQWHSVFWQWYVSVCLDNELETET